MIRYVEVDGFKSLSAFSLDLRPGVNILVGPNGAGKTNVIQFFDFLRHLVQDDLPRAISATGGAGAVFRKIGKDKFQESLTASIYGSHEITRRRHISYCYRFDIAFSETRESIYFGSQRVLLKFRTVPTVGKPKFEDWDLDLERILDAERPKETVVRKLKPEKFHQLLYFHRMERRREDPTADRKLIAMALDDWVGPEECLFLGLGRIAGEMSRLIRDLSGGTIYNVVPSRVKVPEDSARPPGIAQDGSGLYATLYALKKKPESRRRRPILVAPRPNEVFFGTSSLEDVIRFLKLANPAIDTINVDNNPFDNLLQVRVTVTGKEGPSVLPLSAMSDGTIKWLSLLTAIQTNRLMFSVEEPENYLHPLMQMEVLSVLRRALVGDRFALLSTHSETILNSADPDEIVIIEFVDGRTNASRPANADAVRLEIQRTGFGLGYYYVTGGLNNA